MVILTVWNLLHSLYSLIIFYIKYHPIFKVIILAIKHSEGIKDPREIMSKPHNRFKYLEKLILNKMKWNNFSSNREKWFSILITAL